MKYLILFIFFPSMMFSQNYDNNVIIKDSLPNETFYYVKGINYISYYDSALTKIRSIGRINKHCHKHGKWQYFDKSGDIYLKGYYRDGAKIRRWKYYDKSGRIIRKEIY